MTKITISFADEINKSSNLSVYQLEQLLTIFNQCLSYIDKKVYSGLILPYFNFDINFTKQNWLTLSKSLDIYVCGKNEAQILNLNARNKDYATNILSYPSDLSNNIYELINVIPLGELVICHDIVVHEAHMQGKTLENHLSHLLIHGILHLLGFDHELGQDEQDKMESFEIEILKKLGINNPYESNDAQSVGATA